MKASYFYGTQYAGSAEIPGSPDSIAYFCSTCGDCWARIIIPGERFQIRNVPCSRHCPAGVYDWNTKPGSILIWPGITSDNLSTMLWGAALDFLPPAVLKTEFNVALHHYDQATQRT